MAGTQVMLPLDIRQVRVGGEIGRRRDLTVNANLLALDVERDFLQPFRERSLAHGYVGLGKLIDAAVHFAAGASDPRVIALKAPLIAAALRTQEADGYIGILLPENRVWGVYDIHETSHLVLSLAHDYHYFGDPSSLAAARRLADFTLDRWLAEPDRYPGSGNYGWVGSRRVLYGVTLGLDDALMLLYQETGESRYLDFLLTFPLYCLPEWATDPQLATYPEVMLDERHSYIYMALCVAQMQLNQLRPDPALLKQAHKALDFLTRRDGLLVSGSCSLAESWHSDQTGAGEVSESCATAYLIRMMHYLLLAEGDPRYGDLMERALYNALFAAQSPAGRELRYFTALEGPRVYLEGDTGCCPNNFRRIVAELPMVIYYRRGAGVMVNLYTPSEARLELDGGVALTLTQQTDYPSSGEVTLRLEPATPAAFPLYLRVPLWAAGATASVNGEPLDQPLEPGTLLTIERTWHAGDEVQLHLPLEFRWVRGRQLQEGRAALLRGPVLFCLNPARNQEALAGADVHEVVIDPASLSGPLADDSVRPGGQACQVTARASADSDVEVRLTLTEFVDPGGEATHLRVPASAWAEMGDDELREA